METMMKSSTSTKTKRDVQQIRDEISAMSQNLQTGASVSDHTRRDKVLEVLAKHPEGLTAEKLSEETGAALNGLYLVLRSMEAQGRIVRSGTRPRVYKAAEDTVTTAVQHLKFLIGTLNGIATRLTSVSDMLGHQDRTEDPPSSNGKTAHA